MHDLTMTPALGCAPQTIGTLKITENTDVALASVAARRGGEQACRTTVMELLGAIPGAGKAVLDAHDGGVVQGGFWMGQGQWMFSASLETTEDLADQLKQRFGNRISITEQSGAWVVFDVLGEKMPDMFALLCNIAISRTSAGDAKRTMIHQLGCFVIRQARDGHVRVFGPRSSAGSLHHALVTAAKSVA